MKSYLNYVSHQLVKPSYYQRRFDLDLPEEVPAKLETCKRIALLALPFISLYQPIGRAVSLASGSCQAVSNLVQMGGAADKGELSSVAVAMGQTALSVTALAGTFFNVQAAQLLSTFVEMTAGCYRAGRHLGQNEYNKAGEEILQAIGSSLYLAIMIHGSLEVTLASMVVQGLISFYGARKEFEEEGRWPEFIAKMAMGGIRLNQASQQLQMIRRRDFLLSLEKYSQLLQQVNKGKNTRHLINSSLNETSSPTFLYDAEGKPYNFGTHHHGNGKGIVKGMNLQVREVEEGNQKRMQLDFKVNHVFREKLKTQIQGMETLQTNEVREFLILAQSNASDIKIEKGFSHIASLSYPYSCKVTLKGLGSVTVGTASDHFPDSYDRVKVEMEEGKTLFEMHELLSFFNLDDALCSSSSDDIERMKIGQLFRVFYPVYASPMERHDTFFNLPVDELKAKIIMVEPGMKSVFDEYLHKMELIEILPGKMRFSIPGIGDKCYELGARTLIGKVSGSNSGEICNNVASLLKMGSLSTEVRDSHGLTTSPGVSSFFGADGEYSEGSADSVFTQVLTEKNFQDKISLDKSGLIYAGDVTMMFSLDLLDTGTYQYNEECAGTRKWHMGSSTYWLRPNIFDYVKTEAMGFHYGGHQVMIKERIPPSKITGIIARNQMIYDQLVNQLKLSGLITTENGQEMILGRAINEFIHVGTQLSQSWLH